MTKRTKKVIIFALMLTVIALYFVSGTYARYAERYTGNAKVSTANWAVALKDGSNQTLSNNFDLSFEVQSNDNVVPGKIAPSVTAIATVKLDLTGTEVAVDYTATIDKTALATAFGASADSVKVTVGDEESATNTINLKDNAAFTESNGVVPIEIKITWENADGNNASDTTIGKSPKDITLPVTLSVQQHI